MNMLEDGISSMVETLLAKAGSVCQYTSGSNTVTVTMHKRPQQPLLIDSGNGYLTEVLMTHFLTDPSTLPNTEPLKGDTIQVDGETYTVLPISGEKVYRQLAAGMIRIYTKRTS